MQNILKDEIRNIPKVMIADIISSLGLAEVAYDDGEIKCIDGSLWSDDDVYTLLEHYINSSTESDLKDTMTLETAYIVTVSNVVYDDGHDDLPTELSFLIYAQDVDEESEIDDIHNLIDDKVSDKTGFCFVSCDIHIEKYVPYEGSVYLS